MAKKTHGGKRKGAGRKLKYGEESEKVWFWVPVSIVCTVRQAVRKILDKAEKNNKAKNQ